ncbi:NAD(P)/FAD-dependent oxidoreductase [Pseudochryseolinea flava]|uniref:FAD-binding oxidoreductase n=1 Tax=Pseudochryseolinea flava TaxID=2059302 RepID=A0A364Y0L6_9BACT|nr:FAD-dependent oxidoreductase [Pseudochryseolinea flava]RAV99452.1 FAD-binding oxidoreductase [Pseudochryseolinea flava]
MDLKSGLPFSLIKHGLPFEYPKLESSIKTDVAIIGGGISGAITAHELVKAGFDCVVVDGRTIGLGSTCASTSILQYEIDVPLFQLIDKVGARHAVRAYQLCLESIYKLEQLSNEVAFPDFDFRESLYFANNAKDIPFLKEEYAARKRFGFPVSFLETKDVEKLFYFKAPAAILSDVAAHTDAYCLTNYLHQYGIKKGLQVFDRTFVAGISHEKNQVVLKTSEKHSIRARYLINATGYEVTNFIRKKIVKLLATFATISESQAKPVQPWRHDAVYWNTRNPYFYMRSTKDNRVLIGGRDEKFYNPTKRDKLVRRKAKQLIKDFNKIFPGVAFKDEFSWAGTFGSTIDGLPFIGSYNGTPRTYYALGFGGNGITFSVIAADIIRDLLLGKRNPDAKIFSFDRV